MRVTILRASRLLGKALLSEWTTYEITGLSSRDADIRHADAIATKLKETRPDSIILSAAYTNVDDCETNQTLAFAVNRDGAVNVAHAAKNLQARLFFLSSDYVFDGEKKFPYETTDARNP